METPIAFYPLHEEDHWRQLRQSITPRGDVLVADALIEHLKDVSARSLVVEEDYLDRDFTAEFAAFYSHVFKRYRKVCRRLHFFSYDVTHIFRSGQQRPLSEMLQQLKHRKNYLGFVVVRPLEHAPVGRTVLISPTQQPDLRPHVLVRAAYQAHLLGAELEVQGAPFIQQDARVGACAHATIWMAGRHFHIKHRAPWHSVVDVAELASAPTDATLAQSLPAGSGGLGANNIVRALRAMGSEPLLYAGTVEPSNSGIKVRWPPSLQPEDVINRYVDSGIPVILALTPLRVGQNSWHAVLCTGHVLKMVDVNDIRGPRPTRALFCDSFLVNDDQRGCYLRMPVNRAKLKGQTIYPYSVHEHVAWIFVPLPKKVYIKGETAERIAWDFVYYYSRSWPALRAAHGAKLNGSVQSGDAFCDALQRNHVIARTYLTYGWKYKERLLQNTLKQDVKDQMLLQSLPRFIWIVEFGLFSDLNHLDPRDRRIVGHAVIDATSSEFWDALLAFHAPGFLWQWTHDRNQESSKYVVTLMPVADDVSYNPRVRGSGANP